MELSCRADLPAEPECCPDEYAESIKGKRKAPYDKQVFSERCPASVVPSCFSCEFSILRIGFFVHRLSFEAAALRSGPQKCRPNRVKTFDFRLITVDFRICCVPFCHKLQHLSTLTRNVNLGPARKESIAIADHRVCSKSLQASMTVAMGTSSAVAIFRQLMPASRIDRARSRRNTRLGRPSFFPLAWAARMPVGHQNLICSENQRVELGFVRALDAAWLPSERWARSLLRYSHTFVRSS